ncbi:MAG: hypothetical protein A2Z03_10250 [Chloroflexi bacterium RBG_16_56_8]|nr:MAG: hypothetical protein A2Z03_10250 [Chloroflexi bacterium RBG_16_56_8]
MAETISMPKLGFDMQEGTLVRWVKNEGEQINKGDVLAEIETDKATVEVESSAGGLVRKLLVDQGAVVPIGAPIAIVGTADEKIEIPAAEGGQPKTEAKPPAPAKAAPPQPTPAPAPVSKPAPAPEAGPVKASPLARKMASDAKVDLSRLQGTGPGGRIVRRDIEAALAGGQKPAGRPLPSFAPIAYEDQTVQLTKLRQIIARRMTESKVSVPHFYVTHEYRMDTLLALRKEMNEDLTDNEKLSVNDFIVKAAALTLREFPNLNASFAGDKVVRHGAVNVGVAVAVENGLLTVVNRDADQKPLRQIAIEVKGMVARARAGKVRPEDIEGSTFSISNMGMYDVENFAAIINPPEAAILAVGSAREVPVVENGAVKPAWRMKATLSVDHRVSDGAEGAQFMQTLGRYLEQPWRLLL